MTIKLGLPKGRMQEGVFDLLRQAGIAIKSGGRGYRPTVGVDGFVGMDGFETKLLKPQTIVEMLHVGSRDIGFAGADWVAELGAELVDLYDTTLDPVRLVVAAPTTLLEAGKLPKRRLVFASEYERLTQRWIREQGVDASFVKSFGATEVFPPEDADCIVDNSATGSTLRENGLEIVGEVMRSSTRLYAHPKALADATKKAAIDRFTMLIRSVIEARARIMLEVNVSEAALKGVVAVLPCMRKPTIARLHGEEGYAIKAAVPRTLLASLIPDIKARGGSDIVVSEVAQIVP